MSLCLFIVFVKRCFCVGTGNIVTAFDRMTEIAKTLEIKQ